MVEQGIRDLNLLQDGPGQGSKREVRLVQRGAHEIGKPEICFREVTFVKGAVFYKAEEELCLLQPGTCEVEVLECGVDEGGPLKGCLSKLFVYDGDTDEMAVHKCHPA